MYVLVMSRAITEEEAVLLESRLERAAQSWRIITCDGKVPPIAYKSVHLTTESRGAYTRLPRAVHPVPYADLLQKYNLVAAGGFVAKYVNVLSGRDTRLWCDMDIFVVGSDPEDANARVFGCMRDMIAARMGTYMISHNEHTITIKFYSGLFNMPNEYQFILRLYPSIAHIIGGFDISVCGWAYDGVQFYATSLAYYSMQHCCVLVDVTRSSPSFTHRVRKYSQWFNIVFVGVLKTTFERRFEDAKAAVEEFFLNAAAGDLVRDDTFEDWCDRGAEHIRGWKHLVSPSETQCHVMDYLLEKFPVVKNQKEKLHALISKLGISYDYYSGMESIRYNPIFALNVGKFRVNNKMQLVVPIAHQVAKHDYGYKSSDWTGQVNTNLLKAGKHECIYQIHEYDTPIDPADILAHAPQFSSYDASTYGYDPLPTIEAITKRLSKLEWITKNPGRQWTASFDPRPITGPAYYGAIYTGEINQSAVIMTMWLGWYKGPFGVFPRDIMKMLITYTLWAVCRR
jgi:hypothetical protein